MSDKKMQFLSLNCLDRHGIYRTLNRLFHLAWNEVTNKEPCIENIDLDELRHKPDSIDSLCKVTKFSRKELQLIYRGFKQECPNGLVDEERFQHIYSQFFPHGDSSQYASYVFNAFDTEHNGSINFEEFVIGLSALSHGTVAEKLLWTFNLYDLNRDGEINRAEMCEVITSIYALLGRHTKPPVNKSSQQNHIDTVFNKLDVNGDGVVTLQEFMDICMKDDAITRSLAIFDTSL